IEGRAKETAGGARADDNAATLAKRLSVYRTQTAPVAEYYRGKGRLRTVNGMGTVDEVSAAIEKHLRAATEA
ncbi:MAG: adenylate kinase, partial [Rhizobiales bacterium]|nr:adenylate kinase [Hyphomicrobiales bacterium]